MLVVYKCGHTDGLDGLSESAKSDIMKARQARRVCPSCWKVKKLKIVKDISEQIFPKLIGSQKQIIWCERIRTEIFKPYKKMLDELSNFDSIIEIKEKILAWQLPSLELHNKSDYYKQYDFILSVLKHNNDSGWWIGNKDKKIIVIIREIFEDFRNEIIAHLMGRLSLDPADPFSSDWI